MTDRYDTSGNIEAQYQPGSNDQVLANKLGIIDPDLMHDLELDALLRVGEFVLSSVSPHQTLSTAELCDWHRRWLGDIYVWAGSYRSVNVWKANFPFAAAMQIPRLMSLFDQDILGKYTPCVNMDKASLAEAIAIVHLELILIHPFREGNGRLSRLLATVMALQAGWPLLDFTSWDSNKYGYFSAIQAGLDDNKPLTVLVRRLLDDSADSGP